MDVMGEVDIVSKDQIKEQKKAEKEANLVPEGSWEGLVVSWNKVEEDEKGEKSQFHGVSQYRAAIKFFDCPESGQARTGFFNFTPTKILGEKGKPKKAYTTLTQMTEALDMGDRGTAEILEQGKVTRLKYRVAQFTPQGEDTPVNYLQAVSAA